MMHRLPMRRLLAIALATGLVFTGCSTLAVDRFARNEDIVGPWRAEPMPVDPKTVTDAEASCEDARPRLGADHATGDQLVAVDARGGGRVVLIFAGPGNNFMECQLLMDAKGNLRFAGGVVQDVPALLVAANELVVIGAGGMLGSDEASSVSGQIGSAITDVHVVFASGGVVRASVGAGWFTAWWPNHDMGFVVQAFDPSGRKIAEVTR
jgi:hypothetical protein